MLQWLIENKEWIFSGVGVAVITGVIALVRRLFTHNASPSSMEQSGGHGSTNYQAGRDMTIHKE